MRKDRKELMLLISYYIIHGLYYKGKELEENL